METNLIGLAIIWVAFIPSLVYLQGLDRPPLPFFPLVGIFYFVFFGLPIFLVQLMPKKDGMITLYNKVSLENIETQPLILIILGLGLMILTFYLSKHTILRGVWRLRIPNSRHPNSIHLLLWILAGVHFLFELIPAVRSIPSFGQFAAPVIYVAIGGMFLQWRKGILSTTHLFVFLVFFVPLEIFLRASDFLITPILLLMIFVMAVMWRERIHKLIVAFLVLCVCLVSIYDLTTSLRSTRLHGLEFIKMMGSAINQVYILGKDRVVTESQRAVPLAKNRFEPVVHRISQVWVFQTVVKSTPDVTPFWAGESYFPLVTSFIPRLIYPDKPKEQIGYSFGRKYGLLDQNNAPNTSVNLPWITELYANFGAWGIVLGMSLIGLFLAFLDRVFNAEGMDGIEFAIGTTLIFPLIYPESNFSVMTGSILPLFVSLYLYFRFGPIIIDKILRR